MLIIMHLLHIPFTIYSLHTFFTLNNNEARNTYSLYISSFFVCHYQQTRRRYPVHTINNNKANIFFWNTEIFVLSRFEYRAHTTVTLLKSHSLSQLLMLLLWFDHLDDYLSKAESCNVIMMVIFLLWECVCLRGMRINIYRFHSAS